MYTHPLPTMINGWLAPRNRLIALAMLFGSASEMGGSATVGAEAMRAVALLLGILP